MQAYSLQGRQKTLPYDDSTRIYPGATPAQSGVGGELESRNLTYLKEKLQDLQVHTKLECALITFTTALYSLQMLTSSSCIWSHQTHRQKNRSHFPAPGQEKEQLERAPVGSASQIPPVTSEPAHHYF